MNLHKLARFLVLIWLPLANFKLYNKNQLRDLLSNKKNLVTADEENNFVENIVEKMEENSPKKQENKLVLLIREISASNSINAKIGANLSHINSEKNLNSERKLIVAHKFKASVKKDLSALNINSVVKNKSTGKFKRHVTNTLKNPDREIEKIRNIEISVEINSNSLNDNEEDEAENDGIGNSTEIGSFLGASCELTCNQKLLHVFCEPTNKVCECEEKYPVQLDARIGCEKPKQLGDQCFYVETCTFFDPNAICMQINHNAICHCKPGFHAVALRKGVKRMFCSEDVVVVSADFSTLLGVATGIAVLTGLICFVLRLFSGNRYPNTRHFANSNIAPPLLLSSDNQWINGIPLTVHGRPPSRSSCQRSTMNLAQYSRNKGVLVPASRAGAARAAAILLIPCHLQASRHPEALNNSNADDNDVERNDADQTSRLGSRRQSFSSVQSTTSQKSMTYSARRFEQENQQREQRAAIRAAKEDAAKSTASFASSPLSTNGLVPLSNNIEGDPLWTHTEDSLQKSEPPAFSVTEGMTSQVSSPG